MKRPDIYLLPMLLAENSHQSVLTPYALEALKSIKIFFVENIKTTRRFISSLKAGIPMVIVSIVADQPFNGKLIEKNKTGVHIPFKKLTFEKGAFFNV
jgi:16S rRNA C1402 (ribose-2'-O) methylase RsmI